MRPLSPDAGWSSLVARRAHNPQVADSSPDLHRSSFGHRRGLTAWIGHVEADDPIIGFARHLLQIVHHPGLYPLIASATHHCGSRARLVGDWLVSAAEHQDLDELLEDHPIRYAGAMTAQGWFVCLEGNKARNCYQMGSMMYGGKAGTGHAPSRREA